MELVKQTNKTEQNKTPQWSSVVRKRVFCMWRTEDLGGNSETTMVESHYIFGQTHRMDKTNSEPLCELRTLLKSIPVRCRMLVVRWAVSVLGKRYTGNFVLSAQFCYELKSVLKNKIYLRKK